jgi:hypothetical protein
MDSIITHAICVMIEPTSALNHSDDPCRRSRFIHLPAMGINAQHGGRIHRCAPTVIAIHWRPRGRTSEITGRRHSVVLRRQCREALEGRRGGAMAEALADQ